MGSTPWCNRGRRAVGSITGLGLVLLVAAGCGAGASSAADKAADQTYLDSVHGVDPNVNRLRTDTQLLRLGSAACSGFAAGVSFFDLADTMQNTDGGLPSIDLGAVITAAAQDLCPRYRSRVG